MIALKVSKEKKLLVHSFGWIKKRGYLLLWGIIKYSVKKGKIESPDKKKEWGCTGKER